MKNKNVKIGRIIFAIVLICVPLVVAYLLCSYSYNRHKDNGLNIFYAQKKYVKKEEVKDSLYQYEAYLEYTTQYYKKVFEKSVYQGTDRILDLACYEVIYENEGISDLEYRFVALNIDYELLTKASFNNTQEFEFFSDDIPELYVYICDADDPDDTTTQTYTTLDDFYEVVIEDYGRSPDEDSAGTPLESTNVQTGSRYAQNIPADNVAVYISFDGEDDEVHLTVYSEDEPLYLERVLIDAEDDLSIFSAGYNNDYLAAGFVGYMVKKYWWWEALLSLVFVGLLSYSFYIVFTYEKE